MKITVALSMTLLACTVSVVHGQEKSPPSNWNNHWAHVVHVPSGDVADIGSITVVIDRFLVDSKNQQRPLNGYLIPLNRSPHAISAPRFPVDWWKEKHNKEAWFELGESGHPRLVMHVEDGKKQVMQFVKQADPPKEVGFQGAVYILKDADPHCSQPQRHKAYLQIQWWKAFNAHRYTTFAVLLNPKPHLELDETMRKRFDLDRAWGGIELDDDDEENADPPPPAGGGD